MSLPPVQPAAQNLEHIVRDQGARVRSIAGNLARKLPVSVERDDLVQDGFVGLIEAMLRWTRSTNGAHFEGYVTLRVQGAMLDALRSADPGGRALREGMREVEHTIQRLSHSLGRLPREGEVAQAMGIELQAYQSLLQRSQDYKLVSLHDLEDAANQPDYLAECARKNEDPLVVLERSAFRAALAQALSGLGETEQQVLALYYAQGLRMHEVGAALGVSESRVSQLHTQAIAALRAVLLSEDERFAMLTPRRKPRH